MHFCHIPVSMMGEEKIEKGIAIWIPDARDESKISNLIEKVIQT